MIVDASWYVPNTGIRRALQTPKVTEEIRRYSSRYSARLSAHLNDHHWPWPLSSARNCCATVSLKFIFALQLCSFLFQRMKKIFVFTTSRDIILHYLIHHHLPENGADSAALYICNTSLSVSSQFDRKTRCTLDGWISDIF
jgi:hypothetical protein